jgi:hypothetical protein
VWQQSLTGMLIAYLSCAVSESVGFFLWLNIVTPLISPFPVLIFDDFEYDLAVGTRGGCVKDDAERLGGTPLLANHPAQVFLRHLQFQYRSRVVFP